MMISLSENGIKINSMELLRQSGNMVAVSGRSTNMERQKVTRHGNFQMEELTIISSRMVTKTVTEFQHTLEKYIEESSKVADMTVMDL